MPNDAHPLIEMHHRLPLMNCFRIGDQHADLWSLAICRCAFGRKKLVQFVKHQKITGWEEGFIPARPGKFWVNRIGDKSLFPTCEFLMLGDLLRLGAFQEWNENGQTPEISMRIFRSIKSACWKSRSLPDSRRKNSLLKTVHIRILREIGVIL